MNRNECYHDQLDHLPQSKQHDSGKRHTPSRRDECEWKLNFAREASIVGPTQNRCALPPARAGCLPARGVFGASNAVPAGKPASLGRARGHQSDSHGRLTRPRIPIRKFILLHALPGMPIAAFRYSLCFCRFKLSKLGDVGIALREESRHNHKGKRI